MRTPIEDPVSISLGDNEDGLEWSQYVLRTPRATLSHAWIWRSIIREAYGHDSIYLIARQAGMVRGILPLIVVKSSIFGTVLASMPFMDYGGVCTDDYKIAGQLVEEARRLSRATGSATVELRQIAMVPGLPTPREDKVTMILDLTAGEAGIWNGLPAKVRNQVRKAEKCGLSTVVGGPELLEDFYRVFIVNMRDLGSPVHALSFFTSMAVGFGSQMHVRLVRDGNKSIGGMISLCFKDTVLVPWASALREYFSKCPNNLLYWHAIKDSCTRGFKSFDFGRSSLGSGTYEFKRQWGAQPVPLYWYRLSDIDGYGNVIDGSSVKYRLLREIWRRLPVGISAMLGPRIRKYITN
ncbi:MAG TPA: FemAB family XrtA/PEP-CTERM system-associated protein [Nitrospiraceae bacterium]|nr:FemAB family XrtA/PEP-CTERM system-associated protein [Nitrospiraceae bacterium]